MVEPKEIKITDWAPIVGRWTFENGTIKYIGPQDNVPAPFGLCISNIRLTEGSVKASVKLQAETSGRILLSYRSINERYFMAGLAGYDCAYTITKFIPERGWIGVSLAGLEKNLIYDKEYHLETQIVGQRIYLSVDNVRVLEYLPKEPLPDGQVGLFTWGKGEVTFRNVSVIKKPPKIFVVMQFTSPYQQLYSEVIKPVAEEFGFEAYHAGEVYGPGVVLHDISEGIIDAKIIIAEVTPINQNVFYELGYAHALGKPTILLAERGKELPFDISGYRCLFYENSIGGKKQVEDNLRKHLQAITHD